MAHPVLIPPLGQTVDVVTLVQWYKQEGEPVTEGEPLYVIATDKAELDVEAQASGILRQVTAREGDEVEALSAVALIAAPDEVVSDLAVAESDGAALTAGVQAVNFATAPVEDRNDRRESERGRLFVSPRARRLAEREGVPLPEVTGSGPEDAIVERDVRAYLERRSRVTATPVAERLARETGLDLGQVQGSGLGGRITRRDVEAAIDTMAEELPHTERPDNEILAETPLQGVRALIAERMVQSVTTAAQVTLTAEVDATVLVALRRQLATDGVAVSYNDFVLYILGKALQEHPHLNASLEDGVIRRWQRTHIGLAVDTERGLVVPVVRDVGEKRLGQLAQESVDLIRRTQANQVAPAELQGGTFTLTNLGMYGIDAFTPIINPPETAILGIGRIAARPAVVDGEISVRQTAWLSLTFDHRLVDGAPAARFLQRVAQLVEHPHLLHV